MFNILGRNVYNWICRNCSVFQNHGSVNGKREINVTECPWLLFWCLESMTPEQHLGPLKSCTALFYLMWGGGGPRKAWRVLLPPPLKNR